MPVGAEKKSQATDNRLRSVDLDSIPDYSQAYHFPTYRLMMTLTLWLKTSAICSNPITPPNLYILDVNSNPMSAKDT